MPIKIKPSPIIIVKNFLILQVGAVLVYFIAGYATHYAQFYRALKISEVISFQIAQAVFIFTAEFILIFYIFFRWHREYYEIQSGQVVHASGLLHRRRTTIPLQQVTSVAYHRGPLGKIAQYGTIELKDHRSQNVAVLKHIPDPHHWTDLILKSKQQAELPAFYNRPPDLLTLLQTEEHEGLEFKSTFRWDLRSQKVNQHLEKSSLKTIAAFLNSRGGLLVLGVHDNKSVVGLAQDFATLGKENADGFENHFSHIFHKMIGPEFRHLVRLHWQKAGDKECCMVNVAPAHKPAYLKNEENEEFYIRTGNGTTSLKFSEASDYIEGRFSKRSV